MKLPILWRLAPLLVLAGLLAAVQPGRGVTINADFSRNVTPPNPNPLNCPAPVLHAASGPAPDPGNVWNDIQIQLTGAGDDGADSIVHPLSVSNLQASDGSSTAVGLVLSSGFYRAFNSSTTTTPPLQRDWVFARLGDLATLTVTGLDPGLKYDLHLIGAGSFPTAFIVNGVSKVASGVTYDGTWTEGGEHVTFTALAPSAFGTIAIGIQDGAGAIDGNGAIAGLQIRPVENAVNFLYPAAVSSTGGQFNASYPPSNLTNNGFTTPTATISTATDYPALGNNYATVTGTTQNFNLTFDFAVPTAVNGFHVWNYAYRSGANGSPSPSSGVNSYTLTFYTGPGGSGATIGSVFAGNLAAVPWNAANPAQSVFFGSTYTDARSVVMRVLSNHGSTTFSGMNEVAFNGIPSATAPFIGSFTPSAPFVQRPATPTLNWSVSGNVTSLTLSPGIGDVLPLTTGGTGSIAVSPLGEQTYTLTLNGSIQQTVSVVGLPTKEKLHLYLLIGQSNMQGSGAPYSASLDAPVARVVKFGSRNGREPVFVKGGHNLAGLVTDNNGIGMGIEFGKTLLAAQDDPEVVVGLINHALGSSAIQWWAPGVIDNDQVNPVTGQNYYLYDEAVQRVNAASDYGVLKGVLWHQGEYNSGNNTTPDSDPAGYAVRLQALVSNLRNSFGKPALPFVCGKFVPETWTYADGSPGAFTGLPFRSTVESALADLPNHRTNTFCVDNDGLRGRSDQLIHFDAYSQRLLGQRYAAAIHGFQADPHLLYLGGFFTPAQLAMPSFTDPNGDLDGDGLASLLEFAFLTDPSKPQAGSPVALATITLPGEGTFPAVTFRRRIDTEAPSYVVEVSSQLGGSWTSNVQGQPPVTVQEGLPVTHGDGTETVTIRHVVPISDAAQRFLRVRVTLP